MGVPADLPERLISIDSVVAGGRGVGRDGGRVWFVRGGLPGDRVWARVERDRPRFVEAVAVRLERASPDRRRSPCAYQATCGGCPWMPLGEDDQRAWKRRLVVDALVRIAGIEQPRVEPVLAPSRALAYRNRVEFSAAAGASGQAVVGLWGRIEGRRAVVDLSECPLQSAAANALLATIRDFVGAHPDTGRRIVEQGPFRILIRESSTGERLVGLWGAEHRFPSARELASALAAADVRADSVVLLHAKPGRRGGVRVEPLHGTSSITERVGEFSFRLPAASFMQVNPEGAAALVRLVREMAGDVAGRRVLDLFGGVGAFGLQLARAGARWVVVCDADRDAVAAGRRSAREAGLTNTRFVHDTVPAYLRSQRGKGADVVVANPPRTGFGRGVADAILRLEPRKVILVSCDPPTLARDLKPFLSAGYRLERVAPVDLFPQTHHVEAVVLLTRSA